MRAGGETNVIAHAAVLFMAHGGAYIKSASLTAASLAVSMTIMPAKSACHYALISDEPVILLDL